MTAAPDASARRIVAYSICAYAAGWRGSANSSCGPPTSLPANATTAARPSHSARRDASSFSSTSSVRVSGA